MDARQFVKLFTPPVIGHLTSSLRRRLMAQDTLFDGDDVVFKKLCRRCSVFGEYGTGASTLWVAKSTDIPVLSTDTSSAWLQRTSAKLARTAGVELIHIDLGPIGMWGRPLSYERRTEFPDYPMALWSRPPKPDLILVDGRFRVACFLQSLLHARPGAHIVFDDYTDRGIYHVVEEIVRPDELCGRQAIFSVPEIFDRDAALALLTSFQYVID